MTQGGYADIMIICESMSDFILNVNTLKGGFVNNQYLVSKITDWKHFA